MAISTIPSSMAAGMAARTAAKPTGGHSPQIPHPSETDLADTGSASGGGPDSGKSAPSAAPSGMQLDKAMADMKQALPPVARNLQFSVDTDTGRSVIKVVDPVTKEVIRQMPSEELLAITKALDSLSGLFVRQKA